MELYMSERHDTPEAYSELYLKYLQKRQFIYIPIILEELKKADSRGGSFEDAVRASMDRLRAQSAPARG